MATAKSTSKSLTEAKAGESVELEKIEYIVEGETVTALQARIIGETSDKAGLLAQKEKLTARLAEIDARLAAIASAK